MSLEQDMLWDADKREWVPRLIEVPTPLTEAQGQAKDAAAAAELLTVTTNERTIGDALLAALMQNQLAITQLTNWRTTGAGAGTANLTTAQMSAALRTSADNQIAQARQLNGLIRLVKRSLSTADLSSALKG